MLKHPKIPFVLSSSVIVYFCLWGLLSSCTEKLDPLPIGQPTLLGMRGPSSAAIERLEVSLRAPATPAWHVRVEKSVTGTWKLTSRSDGEEKGDVADRKLVEHFLETLNTLSTEGPAGSGTNATFGFEPYRVEVRAATSQKETILQFGDPTGDSIYFRRSADGKPGQVAKPENKTWIVRGALIPFFGHLKSPAAFQLKSPWISEIESIARVILTNASSLPEKTWTFERRGNDWKHGNSLLSGIDSTSLDQILHQRLVRLVSADSAKKENLSVLTEKPDWTIRVVDTQGKEETLFVSLILNQTYGRNPVRTDRFIELYPEFATAIRAFTQARFTPDKSGIK
ncbi:MAG: hypothetical protein H7301_02080 [Cryobacterium sp.]|nr:hypothetical protein [Oligoflexia bacterium]